MDAERLDANHPAYHAVARAVTLIHAEARYYEGLDILCGLIGWGSFHCEGLYPANEMNAWVRRQGAGDKPMETPPELATHPLPAPVMKPVKPWARCKTCGRANVPNKGIRKARKMTCPECGRGINGKRKAKEAV